MKHIGNEIYHIIEKKQLVKRRIARNLEMDPSRFNQLMHRESIDAQLLEKICKEIQVSPGYFFDDWPSEKYTIGKINNQTLIGDAQVNIGQNIKQYEALLAEKDKLIMEKERLIKILSQKAGVDI